VQPIIVIWSRVEAAVALVPVSVELDCWLDVQLQPEGHWAHKAELELLALEPPLCGSVVLELVVVMEAWQVQVQETLVMVTLLILVQVGTGPR
jgi:hypothetical protein